jgi:hypothetical protein
MTTQGANTAPIIGVPAAPVSTAPPADCGSDSQSANVKPLVLMFTFDVSGSMGEGSTACYDRTLKWEPVVAATKAFFADAGSAGISATLTMFPGADPNPDNDGQGGMGGNTLDPALCLGDAYTTPTVPLTQLPSTAFAAALDAYDPLLSGAAWRIGTPTGPGLEGTIAQIESLKITQPDNKYVIVLVTDGAPALCDNATNDVDNVAAILADAAQAGIPTYVIGVDNPVVADMGGGMGGMGGTQCEPLADNLQALAVGGGTDTALIIDTGDPLKTAADFKTAIDKIRDESLNCEVSIPNPPAGRVFDKDEVNVAYLDQSMTEHKLVYDPTCVSPDAWRYDSETAPTTILLCDATCAAVQGMVQAELNVAFGCETARPTGG